MGAVGVGVGQVGVDGVGHAGRGGVGDVPQGGQDVAVADELECGSQVECLVEELHVAGGGLAGGPVGQVGVRRVEFGELLRDDLAGPETTASAAMID